MLQTRALNQKIQELVERQNLEETSEGEIDAGEEGYPQPVEAPKVHPVEDKLLPSEDVKIERAEEGAGSVESVRFDDVKTPSAPTPPPPVCSSAQAPSGAPSYVHSTIPPVLPSDVSSSIASPASGHWTCQRTITETWTFVPGPPPPQIQSTSPNSFIVPISAEALKTAPSEKGPRPLRLAPHARSRSSVSSSRSQSKKSQLTARRRVKRNKRRRW